MSEAGTQVSSSWRPSQLLQRATGAEKESKPRSPATRLLLSRFPVTILAAAYVLDFLLRQFPEFAGVHVLAQIGRQASVLVWAPLPGLGGEGASGADGAFVLLAIVGAIALAIIGKRPSFPVASIPNAVLVAGGIGFRIVSVLSGTWTPVPIAGLAFGGLAIVTALFAVREILLAPAPAATGSSAASAEDGGSGWRGTRWFFLIILTWIGDVAIGRYYEPGLTAAINRVAPSARWDYLTDNSSWWLYLLGAIVVLIAYSVLQLLPPWGGRARQIVIAAVVAIAGIVAFQQAHPYVQDAVAHVIRYGPSK
ncbi:MAG TPA: hypothetical protein VK817_08040 [Trebonia sp.]|jgi:hypothetical protein|nr:hypothetical protein [Trebonia sp.]